MIKLHKSEGDINISPRREKWQKEHIDAESWSLLDEDARYFLKQSLSTPCLNTLRTGVNQDRWLLNIRGNLWYVDK